MWRYDMEWIIILILIYINVFRVEKWRNQLMTIFTWGSHFGELGSIIFWKQFEILNDTFHGFKLLRLRKRPKRPLNLIFHINSFPTTQESPQLEFTCKCYANWKLTFLYWLPWFGMMPCWPPSFAENGLFMWPWRRAL